MDSDIEVIDNSITSDTEHRTVFVAGSEDDSDDENYDSNNTTNCKSLRLSLSDAEDSTVRSDNDEDRSRMDSKSRLENSYNAADGSDSEEEAQEMSPELLPRRPPPKKDQEDTSFIGRKTKKRIMLIDSDTDNSIIIEHDKNKKMTCLKDTPVKFTTDKDLYQSTLKKVNITANMSQDDSEMCNSDIDDSDSEAEDESKTEEDNAEPVLPNRNLSDEHSAAEHDDNHADSGTNFDNDDDEEEEAMIFSKATRMSIMGIVPKNDDESDDSDFIASDESNHKSVGSTNSLNDLPDVELSTTLPHTPLKATKPTNSNHKSVGSTNSLNDLPDVELSTTLPHTPLKATKPANSNHKSVGSTNSLNDLLDVELSTTLPQTPLNTTKPTNSNHKSMGSTNSLNDLPDVELSSTLPQTPLKTTKPTNDSDSSRISCSPFSSPMADLTNRNILNTTGNVKEKTKKSIVVDSEGDDLIIIEDNQNTSTFSRNSRITNSKRMRLSSKENEIVYDEDVTIIDSKPEVIALSSDDEDEEKKRSPRPKKESQDSNEESKTKRSQDIKQYLLPESYPNQVVYVKKNVRENELRKLEGLKADLHGVKMLLEKMDPSYLPDTGMKLGERLASLEKQVRVQGTKVANMLVEPDSPSIEQMSNDGFGSQDKGLSWDDLQAGSNAVQPRWFGKQGMATHMAERNLILERLRLLHASLASRPAEDAHAPAPRALRATLLPHQAHALAWLQWRETQRPPAGILADDMGLGKTITMIALIASDKERASEGDSDDEDYAGQKLIKGGSLVVCPASLIQQWANEVTKHCKPHQLSVSLHHGANRAKQAGRLAHNDIVVTTYNILQRDGDASGVLGRILWRRIILDEAHVVRNHKSATSNAVCTLKGSRRWCLTGTPVQNKDLDLFALVKFMRCSPFDDLVMWKKWIDNKSHGGQERMSTLMRCILLRRSKAQLQARGQLSCLPARTAHLKEVTLSQQEMNVYQKVLVFSKTLFAQFLEQRAEKQAAVGFGGRGNAAYDNMHKKMIALQGAKPVKSHEILVLLLRLRQVCCHCGLIAAMLDAADADAGLDEDAGSKDLLAELNKLSLDDSTVKVSSNVDDVTSAPDEGTSVTEAIRSVLSPNNPVFNLKQRSSKIEAVMDCLESNVFKNKGEKAIVVSQWTSVLRLVETELLSRKIKCVTLSGAVPVAQRHALVTKINDPNSDVTVMLLSLCAGGVGLNLCGANHLLLLDPHWNPQLEEQAQDRIYRVGQRRAVHVYRFMCVDTVEQSIRNLQQAKLKLAEAVLTGAKNSASKLTIEDLKLLFNMGPTSQDKPVK